MKINITAALKAYKERKDYDTSKLDEAFAAVEGRCTARCQNGLDVLNTLSRITVPMSRLSGTKVFWNGGEKFPAAYKGRPESTHWTAECIGKSWYVTDISRGECPNRVSSGRVEYSDAAKEWLLEQAATINW